jgi:hypothetical protein
MAARKRSGEPTVNLICESPRFRAPSKDSAKAPPRIVSTPAQAAQKLGCRDSRTTSNTRLHFPVASTNYEPSHILGAAHIHGINQARKTAGLGLGLGGMGRRGTMNRRFIPPLAARV